MKNAEGLEQVVEWLEEQRARGLTASGRPGKAAHSHEAHHHG
jgi:hypothetical protein